MTLVDRTTSGLLGWAVSRERSEPTLQAIVDDAPSAAFYFSDLFAPYRQLVYYPDDIHRCRTKARRFAGKGIMPNSDII